jgi:hypothetical protein
MLYKYGTLTTPQGFINVKKNRLTGSISSVIKPNHLILMLIKKYKHTFKQKDTK